MSRERRGETGKQIRWQRDLEIGLSETERQQGRFCFLLKSSSVKPELPFSKPTRVQDLRQATMKLSCSLSKALSDFHSSTSTYSQILPLLLLLSKATLGEQLLTQEWESSQQGEVKITALQKKRAHRYTALNSGRCCICWQSYFTVKRVGWVNNLGTSISYPISQVGARKCCCLSQYKQSLRGCKCPPEANSALQSSHCVLPEQSGDSSLNMTQTTQPPPKINLVTQNTAEKVLCITADAFCVLQTCDINQFPLINHKNMNHNARRRRF